SLCHRPQIVLVLLRDCQSGAWRATSRWGRPRQWPTAASRSQAGLSYLLGGSVLVVIRVWGLEPPIALMPWQARQQTRLAQTPTPEWVESKREFAGPRLQFPECSPLHPRGIGVRQRHRHDRGP